MRIFGIAACFIGALAKAQSAADSAGMIAALSSSMRILAPAQFVLEHRTELALTREQIPLLDSLVRAQADSMKVRMQRRVTTTPPSRGEELDVVERANR